MEQCLVVVQTEADQQLPAGPDTAVVAAVVTVVVVVVAVEAAAAEC